MKIIGIKSENKGTFPTTTIQTDKGTINLKRFGKDFVCLDNIPYGFNKESKLYLDIKKCLISGGDLGQFLGCSF